MNLRNKVILVTGGGSGIGQQLVLNLLLRGATVAAADINENGLNQTRLLAGALADRLSLHKTDISDRGAVKALADEIIGLHGHVDGIINNAGIIHRFEPVSELGFDVIDRIINVNLHGVFSITKAFLPHLKTRPEALITNISSMGGLFAFPNQTIYGASKAAVKLFTAAIKIIHAIEKNRFRAHIGIDAKILSFLYTLSPKYTILLISKAMKLVMGN